MGDGNIDPKDVAILKGIANWWQVNGESIRGTTRTPLPVQTWGESTRKGNTLYLHVFHWPANGGLSQEELVVGGLESSVKGARLLADKLMQSPPQLHTGRLNPRDVKIDGLPAIMPGEADYVIKLEGDGDIQTNTHRLLQPAFPSETLRAFDGELHGHGLRFGPGKKSDDVVLGWTKPDQFITWPVRLNQAAAYEVLIHYLAGGERAGGTFTVTLGSQTLTGEARGRSDQTVSLGRVSLAPGEFDITVAAAKIDGDELFRLRSLELKPVAAN